MNNFFYLVFENSAMYQMFQYFNRGIVLEKIYMNPGNDNDYEITLLTDLFTEITLWYTLNNVCKT